MIYLLGALFLLFGNCWANTETHLTRVPLYYDIPAHPNAIPLSAKTKREYTILNDTHTLIADFPIISLTDSAGISNVISLNYNTQTKPLQTLLIRVNNYNDSTFEQYDLINTKLCWPAINPFEFSINHRFFTDAEIGVSSKNSQLNLYIEVQYYFHAHTYNPAFLKSNELLEFQLYITKLPNRYIPIPLELYPFIMYFFDLAIVMATVVPMLTKYLFPSLQL